MEEKLKKYKTIFSKGGIVAIILALVIATIFSVLSVSLNITKNQTDTTRAMAEEYQKIANQDEERTNKMQSEIEEIVITNTYIGPEIKSSKTAKILLKEGENRNYALEEDTIEYTITVENSGLMAINVTIKDTIPEGTTFQPGSILVDGQEKYYLSKNPADESTEKEEKHTSSLTDTNLSTEGIVVTVPKGTKDGDSQTKGKVTVSFKVTVNRFTEEEAELETKEITNIAKVNDGIKEEESVESNTVQVKRSRISIQKSSETKKQVAKEDIIDYKIVVSNEGENEETVKIKDTIPAGTEFVKGSIKIDNKEELDKDETHLKEGIEVLVPAKDEETAGTVTLEFKVKVTGKIDPSLELEKTELENGDEITNIAIVENEKGQETPSEEVKHTYVKPIITNKKKAELVKAGGEVEDELISGRDYALEGDIIKYTITVENAGDLAKNVTIKDNIPNGTTFVEDSIKVEPSQDEAPEGGYKENDLTTKGIIVNVPAASDSSSLPSIKNPGRVTLSFKVKVNNIQGYKEEIKNRANIDGEDGTDETITEVYKSDISIDKKGETTRGDKATAGDEIQYTIEVTNNGTAEAKVKIEDKIPEGTTYKEGSIEVSGATDYETGEEYKTDGEKGNRIETIVTVPAATGEELGAKVPGKVTLSFKVKVDETGLSEKEGDQIINVATITENPDEPGSEDRQRETPTVVHKYVEPIISSEKTAETPNGKGYVTSKEEEISYTITLTNEGSLEKEVLVKDELPEGLTAKEGTLEVKSGENVQEGHTLQELTGSGIRITVPAAKINELATKENGIATIKFTATINSEGFDTKNEFVNKATVNKDPQKSPEAGPEDPNVEEKSVTTPVVTIAKAAKVVERKNSESTLEGTQVTVGDVIEYTITVKNLSQQAVENIEVKDIIPEGTELAESIQSEDENITGSYDEHNKTITWTIAKIEAEQSEEVKFKARVKYTQAKENVKILNKATVDEKETNETSNDYVKPTPQVKSELTKNSSTPTIVLKNAEVYYEINFSATVEDFVGKAKITMVDTLPYPLDKAKMKEMAEQKGINTNSGEEWLKKLLNGGEYKETENGDDGKTYTITWVDEVEDIDTFTKGQAQTISKQKTISVKYDYGKITEEKNVTNTVDSKIELIEPESEEPVAQESKQAEKSIPMEIQGSVVTHHYIYDPEITEADGYTTKQIADDETQIGKIGDTYSTSPSENIPANYTCKTLEPEHHTGNFEEDEIEVIYYYELTTPTIESNIEKTAQIGGAVKEETTGEEPEQVTSKVLTREDGIVTYNISYTSKVTNYIGKITVQIVDTLPAKIDPEAEGTDLKGGEYDGNKTITWTKEIENIDTYANETGETEDGSYADGAFTIEFAQQIKVVYVDQDVTEDLENSVTGTTIVYYPEEHTTDPGEEQVSKEVTDTETLKQEYKANLKVVKQWDDGDDYRGLRPASITVNVNGEDINLTSEGEPAWTYTESDLPKYDEEGEIIDYSDVIEPEVEHYTSEIIKSTEITDEATNYIVTVKNTYELRDVIFENTEITKESSLEEITSSGEVVDYTITFNSDIKEYVGKGYVEIIDTLPYALNEEKMKELAESHNIDTSEENWLKEFLDGGVYDDKTNTITWQEDLGDINTYTENEETYKVNVIKEISLIFKDMDASKAKLANTVTGQVKLDQIQSQKPEATYEIDVNIMGQVKVKYVDEEGNSLLPEGEEELLLEGKVGNSYETEEKEFPGYTLERVEGKTEGEYTEEEQIVVYHYKKAQGKVTVRYVDEDGNDIENPVDTEGNPVKNPEVKTGEVGSSYTTERKELEGYEYVETQGDEQGTFTEEEQEVVYVYKKLTARVIVRYLEKGTNEELLDELVIEGNVGDVYQTSREVIKNYKSADPEPTNSVGRMTKEEIIVTYYYERIPAGKVTVKYLDVDTKEDLTYIEEHEDGTQEEKKYGYDIEGNAGDKYTTEKFDIPYYNLFKVPANAAGELTEDGDTVIYYYQKKPFNFSIEKMLKSIVLNNEVKNIINNKSTKVEIVAATIPYAQLQVSYKIIVKNTGEIDGKAKVIEMLPEGYKLVNVANYWAQTKDGNLETIVELKAGETKELEVTLQWLNSNDNFGIFENTAKIVDLENEANFKETSEEDNVSSVELITSIKTGMEENVILIVTGIGLIITLCVLVYLYERYNKERGIPMRRITIENKKLVIKK